MLENETVRPGNPTLPTSRHRQFSAILGPDHRPIVLTTVRMSLPSASGVVIAWIFNLWGAADLFNAFYQANHAGLMPGQLGATYFIPTFIVPLLLITHGLGFRILVQRQSQPAIQESRHLA